MANSNAPISVDVLQGTALLPRLDELARLRIEVFRDWPYLYDGDLAHERQYLKSFAKSKSSTMVIAVAHPTPSEQVVVGVSTAMALSEESAAIRKPFEQAGYDVSQWFYLAESVLQHEYRGRGLGHAFFDAREAAGKRAGFSRFTFCAVEREADDPRKPGDARSLEPFWRQRGYNPLAFSCTLKWKELGGDAQTHQRLRFWARDIA